MASSKAERISHFAIIFIAVSALFISIWQGYVTQKHNRLTVLPILNLSVSTNTVGSDQQFHLELTNQGYGPAKIKAFEISVDGVPQPHWNAALAILGIEHTMSQAANFDVDDVFAAGKEQTLLTLSNYGGTGRIKLTIIYESIYGDEDIEDAEF